MHQSSRRRIAHAVFVAGIVFKGVDGLLELFAGVLLAAESRWKLLGWIRRATAPELSEDPSDFIANHVRAWSARHLSAHFRGLAGLYLVVHGLIKVALAAAVLRGVPRAYPWAMAVIGSFAAYLLYRAVQQRSPGLAVLVSIDAAIVALLAREYSLRRKSASPRA